LYIFVWFVNLSVGYHLCRLYSIFLEEDSDLDFRKVMLESSCGLFEGTQHVILQKLRWRVGVVIEGERINDAVDCDDCIACGVDE